MTPSTNPSTLLARDVVSVQFGGALAATLLPLGFLQLYESVANGYWEARELEFLTNDTNTLIEWLRLPGDIVFVPESFF